MPVNEEIDENQLEEYIEKGGLNPQTTAKRKRVVDGFHRYVSGKEKEVAALLEQPEELEETLISYFGSLKVVKPGKNPELPKKGYLDLIKSHLKQYILKETDKGFSTQ